MFLFELLIPRVDSFATASGRLIFFFVNLREGFG
jgi:hypothetical protein